MKTPLKLAALLCGCLLATIAFAAPGKEPGFKFGKGWTLLPQVNLGVFWESNARDTVNDEESGGGWRVQPSFSLNYTASRTRLGINGFYTFERGFDNDDALDSDSYGVSFAILRELSQRWNFSLSASAEDPDNGDTSTSYTLMTGISHTISERLSLRAMVGASFQDYQGYSDDTSVDPSYSLSLSYRLSQRVALALSLNSRYESEYYNGAFYNAKTTYVWSHNLTGSMTVQWSDKLYSSLSLSGFYEEHVATAPGLSDRDRTYIQVAFNTSYRFNNYVSMYGSVSWKNDQYDGNGDDSADDIRLDVGLTFTL